MNIKRVMFTVLAIIGLVVVLGGAVIAYKFLHNPFVGKWSNGSEDATLIIEKNDNAYITSRGSDVESFYYEIGVGEILLTSESDPSQRALCRLTSDGHLLMYIPWDAREPTQILTRVK